MRWKAVVMVAAVVGALVGLVPTTAAGQVGTLVGMVQDDLSGLILPGAEIEVEGTTREGVADRMGRFILTDVPSGSRTVVVRYMGFAEARQTVDLVAGETSSLTFRLQPEAFSLEGIVATGRRDGQARALQQQRVAPNITNVVAADQIGRFPDANIGDAMKRIPGVTVMVDQGEARFGLIRGTEPRLNSITLNGERVPSAEGEVREVQLDLIPSDMVQSIEVHKAVTPDMDADAIGASVNIVTRRDPPGRRVSATFGSGYNALVDKGMLLGSLFYADRVAGDRLGFTVAGSAFNHHLGSDNIEAVWDQGTGGRAFIEEMDVRRYDVQRLRRSLSFSTDYALSATSSIDFSAMYNHRDDWENRFRLRYALDEPDPAGMVSGDVRRQTKGGGADVDYTRLEDQRVLSLRLGGAHLLGSRLRMSWSTGYGKASEDRPDERYVEWEASDVTLREDVSDPGKPSFSPAASGDLGLDRFDFRRIEVLNSLTEEEDRTGRIDFALPLDRDGALGEVRFGARVRSKSKFRDNEFFRAIPQDGALTNAAEGSADYTRPHLAGIEYRYGTFTRPEYLGELPVWEGGRFALDDRPDEYAFGNYDANENVRAGYALWDHAFDNGLSLIAGVRVERTDIEYSGFQLDAETDEVLPTPTRTDDYTNVLPGLHLRYETRGGAVVRAAWTNTISRPNYFDLVPYRIVSHEDLVLQTGNPDLDPTTAMNFDLMADRYFAGVGLVSAGLFYKDIDSFIFTYTRRNAADPLTGTVFQEITQPLNGSNASLFGFEVAVQRRLDFLPGLLSGLGLYANYTRTASSIEGLNVEGREDEDLPLPGSAKHTVNTSLSYELGRVSLRGSINYSSDFIDPGAIGDAAFFDRYYDTRTDVDVNGSFALTNHASLFVEANNLTNQPLRYYQGVRARMMQEEFYSRRFTLGMKLDF